jgi:hypothetical protein
MAYRRDDFSLPVDLLIWLVGVGLIALAIYHAGCP